MGRTSRVTSQNQVSVPSEVRRRFRIHPGTELVWEERNGALVVRPKRYSLSNIQLILQDRKVKALTLDEIEEAKHALVFRKYVRGRS